MAALVNVIHESLDGEERDEEIRRLIREKKEQIETLEQMLSERAQDGTVVVDPRSRGG